MIGAWVRPAETLSQTEADCPRNISAAGVSAQWSVARRETMLSDSESDHVALADTDRTRTDRRPPQSTHSCVSHTQ